MLTQFLLRDIVQFVVGMLQSKDKLLAHVGHICCDGRFIGNAMAFYCDKYLRAPWNTSGAFYRI